MGLSNLITMGIKTNNTLMGMEWLSGEVAASTKHLISG